MTSASLQAQAVGKNASCQRQSPGGHGHQPERVSHSPGLGAAPPFEQLRHRLESEQIELRVEMSAVENKGMFESAASQERGCEVAGADLGLRLRVLVSCGCESAVLREYQLLLSIYNQN